MSYWYGLLFGILIGGTLGTIATALIVGSRMGMVSEEQQEIIHKS